MDPDQLAVNSVSTASDAADLEATLAAYADAGFGNVEFQLSPVREYADAHGTGVVADLLDDHGLDCVGGFEGTVACFADDVAAANERHVRNAELLDALGAERMVVGTDGPDGDPGPAVLEEYATAFGTLADELAHTGVTVCIEFNWSPVIRSLRSAATVARAAGDGVGVLFDPAHYHCTPTKRAELTPENVAQIAHVHVDDMADKPGELSDCNADRELPGEGHLDLDSLFGPIEAHGYDGYFSVELFDDELRSLPVGAAARRLYDGLRPLCD